MSGPEKTNKFGGIGLAFADRNFRVYSYGSIGSWISFYVQLVAVSWLTWELTHSTTWLAIMGLMDIVPNVVLMPFAGALADRIDRHKIMLVTSFLLLLQAGAMAVLAGYDQLTLGPLAVLVLIHGILITFMVPAMLSTLPRFVDRGTLPTALAVASSYSQLAIFAGPALAGWIISEHGLALAFAVNAVGYLFLLLAFLALRTPVDYKQPAASNHSFMRDIIDGFVYIRRNVKFMSLLWLGLISNMLVGAFYHMLPAYADQILGKGLYGMSTILAAMGAGSVVAALWLAHGGVDTARTGRVIAATFVTLIALAALSVTQNLYLAVVFAILVGIAAEMRGIAAKTIMQLLVSESHRGRVMGTVFMLSELAIGIGTWIIGSLAAGHGLAIPMVIGVAVGLLLWLPVYLGRHKLMAEPDQ